MVTVNGRVLVVGLCAGRQAVKHGQPMSNVNAGKGFENRKTNTDWVYFKHVIVVLLGHDAKSISRPNGLNSTGEPVGRVNLLGRMLERYRDQKEKKKEMKRVGPFVPRIFPDIYRRATPNPGRIVSAAWPRYPVTDRTAGITPHSKTENHQISLSFAPDGLCVLAMLSS